MVQIKSLSKKPLPLSMSDIMVGTDVVAPTKPVKNFSIQELDDFFFGGWSFEERTYVLDSSTPIVSQNSVGTGVFVIEVVPPAPPGKFTIIDPKYATWQTIHEPGNPLISTSALPAVFIGQYWDFNYNLLASASLLSATAGGGLTFLSDVGIGNESFPESSVNTISKLTISPTFGGSDYPVSVSANGTRVLVTGFSTQNFVGKATIKLQVRYKYININ